MKRAPNFVRHVLERTPSQRTGRLPAHLPLEARRDRLLELVGAEADERAGRMDAPGTDPLLVLGDVSRGRTGHLEPPPRYRRRGGFRAPARAPLARGRSPLARVRPAVGRPRDLSLRLAIRAPSASTPSFAQTTSSATMV